MTQPAPLPDNEAERLALLHDLLVLDSAPEPLFDSFARMASEACGVPVALISLVDDTRQWFKANIGLGAVQETSRDVAFCAYALGSDQVLEVPDATQDSRFASNPLVTGDPNIRFYAGAPLTLPGGVNVGTLCVLGHQPGALTPEQERSLQNLAHLVTQALQMRRDLLRQALAVRSQYEQALAGSEAFLQHTGRMAGVGGWQVDLRSGAMTWSSHTRRIHEVDDDYRPQLAGAIDFYAPEARPVIQAAVDTGIATGAPWDLELPLRTARGRHIWVRAVGEVQFEAGRAVRLLGAFQDITERRAAQQLVALQTATLRSVIEAIPAIVAVVGNDNTYRYVNSAFERWVGAPRERIVGRPVPEVLGRATTELFKPWVTRALAGETVSFEAPVSSATGGQHLAVSYIPLWLDDGTVDGFVSVRFDITQHQEQKTQLLLLTQRDPLTGLLNRAGFEEALQRCQDSRREHGARAALLYIDLDHFKPVNDAHGHPVGDRVLQLFGQRLQGLVRPSDAVARLGGDEFAVLLVAVGEAANAQRVADKIIAMAQQAFAVDGLQLRIGASVGVAFGLHSAGGWPELLARADAQLYCAKRAGRGRQAGGLEPERLSIGR